MRLKNKKTKLLASKIRIHALNMTNKGGSSHIGSIFSIADIVACLYGSILKFDCQNPKFKERDRFILSKGHAGAGIYAALAELKFFPTEKLKTHYQNGSDLSGHISHINVPGVELSTGSLGHGLPVANGMAFYGKLKKKKHKIYVLLSDGECDEGSNWEAALFSSHHELNNLIVIIDYNKLQSIKSTKETLDLEPFSDKWVSFGWDVKIIDGHNHTEIIEACSSDINSRNKPLCIIANTIKGRGVSFMENQVLWHYRSPKGKEFINALKELKEIEKKLL